MAKLWGGRFEGQADALVEALGQSVSFDARLAPWDIRGSIAHARMLGQCGIIPRRDAQKIVAGLHQIARDIADGAFVFDPALEDVHTNIESALVKRIGDAGKRLHTGRSRNDQIALDVRLWLRDQIDAVRAQLRALQRALLDMADAHIGVILPGCTHLQHAQPVLLAHHLLAYVEMLERDHERFSQLHARANVLPLGSAALAGTPYPIDRDMVARELGFPSVSRNSMDAVADRDHLIEFCAGAALCMMHLSRWCEELILWSTPEFGFIEIGDAFTTGSSIMPQKKNPDALELARGKTGRMVGNLVGLLTALKGIPSAYDKDLQEDKEPLFDTLDTLELELPVMTGVIATLKVNAGRMARALGDELLATDLADALVRRGVPFRESHRLVGLAVRRALAQGCGLRGLSVEDYAAISPAFGDDITSVLDFAASVARHDVTGGTAPAAVAEQLRRARERLRD